MNHVERFHATIDRRPVDRPCTWLGLPTEEAWPGLLQHFGCDSRNALIERLDYDVVPVELPYHSPTSDLCITQIFLEGGGWAVWRKKYSCLR